MRSPLKCLDAALEFLPHVAFVDVTMPLLSGFELARLFRAEPALVGCQLVAVTGHVRPPDGESRETFDVYLTKPIDLAEVRGIVAAIALGESVRSAQA